MLSLGQLLAACASDDGPPTFADAPSGLVNFANWPYYLDRDGTPTNGPGPFRPSLEAFTDETGILVNYREVIPDAETFFKMIEPRLAADQPTGWDIIVITNGSTPSSPLVFLSDEDRQRLRTYRDLRTPEELATCAEVFGEFYL